MTVGSFTPEHEFTAEQMWASLPLDDCMMTITPAVARNWLDTRCRRDLRQQRALSKPTARRYADMMLAKRFPASHQGVAFDSEGLLLDGQHTLEAITLAQTLLTAAFRVKEPTRAQREAMVNFPTGEFVLMRRVFVDVPRDTFAYMDIGSQRHARQLYGAKFAQPVTSAARWLFPDEVGAYHRGGTPGEVLDVADSWAGLDMYAPDAHLIGLRTHIPTPQHLAILAQVLRTARREKIPAWLDALKSGAGLEAGDPRLQLRERFAADHKTLTPNRDACYNLIAKAWNLYAAGERRQLLVWRYIEGPVAVAGFAREGADPPGA